MIFPFLGQPKHCVSWVVLSFLPPAYISDYLDVLIKKVLIKKKCIYFIDFRRYACAILRLGYIINTIYEVPTTFRAKTAGSVTSRIRDPRRQQGQQCSPDSPDVSPDRLCQRTKWEMTFLGARFPCFDKRRICHLAGLIRQYRTKSYRAFCEADVEKLKKFSLHSVYLTYWCPPPGIPLSAICMDVSKVSLSKATRGLNVELSSQIVDPGEAVCIFFG